MPRTERGAAAVEFALISLILLPLILGMIQYGLYFNDSLQARQATRLGARTGVVVAAVTCSDASATTDAAKLACYTKSQVSPASGAVAVMVKTGGTWARGQTLYVCAVVKSAGAAAGIVPVPNNGYTRSVTAMSIEKDNATSGITNPTGFTSSPFTAYASDTTPSSTDPSGASWSWCA